MPPRARWTATNPPPRCPRRLPRRLPQVRHPSHHTCHPPPPPEIARIAPHRAPVPGAPRRMGGNDYVWWELRPQEGARSDQMSGIASAPLMAILMPAIRKHYSARVACRIIRMVSSDL